LRESLSYAVWWIFGGHFARMCCHLQCMYGTGKAVVNGISVAGPLNSQMSTVPRCWYTRWSQYAWPKRRQISTTLHSDISAGTATVTSTVAFARHTYIHSYRFHISHISAWNITLSPEQFPTSFLSEESSESGLIPLSRSVTTSSFNGCVHIPRTIFAERTINLHVVPAELSILLIREQASKQSPST
jgi:hypothetical protein